ncbi:protein kinase [Phytophthora infestans T30-4]|uniref:Protein kinase n=1 Tax=Phytophthora infestans (strain T30-4) TaxID=403677 RepID=D0NDL7_PHYIT|nr:protein kinase [Phytophthora infestans T30-4]EEY56174.1 protein kinase [Phytophthora infestans T30-4]|eukprot:XP_002903004.1 protein kinase [Phytophthora infestans T30-4]
MGRNLQRIRCQRTVDNDNCTAVACSPKIFGDSTNYYETTICYSTDRLSYSPMEDLFLGQTFLEGQAYGDNNCTDEAYKYRQGLLVGECEPFTTKDNYMYSVSATLASNGSVVMSIYNNTACTDLPITTYALRSDTLASHLCYNDTGLPHVVSSIVGFLQLDDNRSGFLARRTNLVMLDYLQVDVYLESDCKDSYGQDALLASGHSGDGSSVTA